MSDWMPIETAPIGEMVWLWSGAWRHAFPGRHCGNGEVWIDTCEPEAKGWKGYATHWMPLPEPPKEAGTNG